MIFYIALILIICYHINILNFLRRVAMIARIWKKAGLIILIIACLFNIVNKLVTKTSLLEELRETAQYVYNNMQISKDK